MNVNIIFKDSAKRKYTVTNLLKKSLQRHSHKRRADHFVSYVFEDSFTVYCKDKNRF